MCRLWGARASDWSLTGKAFCRLRQAETFWRQSCSAVTSQVALGSGSDSALPSETILRKIIARNI